MLDNSEYVQKGIGTLLRGLWKKYPADIEIFLMNSNVGENKSLTTDE